MAQSLRSQAARQRRSTSCIGLIRATPRPLQFVDRKPNVDLTFRVQYAVLEHEDDDGCRPSAENAPLRSGIAWSTFGHGRRWLFRDAEVVRMSLEFAFEGRRGSERAERIMLAGDRLELRAVTLLGNVVAGHHDTLDTIDATIVDHSTVTGRIK
jgi:hypothetical protein